MERRKFIESSTKGLLSLAMVQNIFSQNCTPTTTDRYGLGPFHLPNIPERNKLTMETDPGEKMKISGALLEPDCQTPVTNARVEVWQADTAGCYSHPNSCGVGEDYYLYGTLNTGSDGKYSFESILPERYLNGPQYRPRHIHYKVTTQDQRELVTQLYFEGDEYIPTDLGANDPGAVERIVPLQNLNSVWEGEFNIHLVQGTGIKKDMSVIRNNANLRIISYENHVEFFSPFLMDDSQGQLKIYNLNGQMLLSESMNGDKFILDKKQFKIGYYKAVLESNGATSIRVFQVTK